MDFYFMAGLPRTGTNLLSQIFSQNNEIYLSFNSSLPQYLRLMDNYSNQAEDHKLGYMKDQHDNIIKNAISSYYSTNKEKIIIDKSRFWGAPYFINLLKRILPYSPKLLIPVRPLTEVVASFVHKAQQYPGSNFIDKAMISEDFLPYWRKPINDARVDWLLKPEGLIQLSMLSISAAINDKNSEMFHVYTYDDLITNTYDTVSEICNFINASSNEYNLNKITKKQNFNEYKVLGVSGFYDVRQEIVKTSPDPEVILSDYSINRCISEDFWTNKIAKNKKYA